MSTASFLEVKPDTEDASYTPTEAFFLGAMLASSDVIIDYDCMCVSVNNPQYVSEMDVSLHRKALESMALMTGGEFGTLPRRRGLSGKKGFSVSFRTKTDTRDSILSRAKTVLENGDSLTSSALLSGIFDGRGYFDGEALSIGLPKEANTNEIEELLIKATNSLGIERRETNRKRARRTGGSDRRYQFRLTVEGTKTFLARIGLVSPILLKKSAELFNYRITEERHHFDLPNLRYFVEYEPESSDSDSETDHFDKLLVTAYLHNALENKGTSTNDLRTTLLDDYYCTVESDQLIEEALDRIESRHELKDISYDSDDSIQEILDYFDISITELPFTYQAKTYVEGGQIQHEKLASETKRSPRARAKCLELHGTACFICGYDSMKLYGIPGIIEVHHLHPLADGTERETDPQIDLVPLCPNCHALVHKKKGKGCYTVNEARKLLGYPAIDGWE